MATILNVFTAGRKVLKAGAIAIANNQRVTAGFEQGAFALQTMVERQLSDRQQVAVEVHGYLNITHLIMSPIPVIPTRFLNSFSNVQVQPLCYTFLGYYKRFPALRLRRITIDDPAFTVSNDH